MPTDTTLIEKREELKRRLTVGEYKTLVDVLLARTDRLLRNITRRSKPLPIWLITIIVIPALALISFAAIYVAGDWATIRNIFELSLGSRPGVLPIILLMTSGFILLIASAVVINRYVGRIIVLWRDEVLVATESVASLDGFEDWLKMACNWRLHLLVSIIGGLLSGSYFVALIDTLPGIIVDYSSMFTVIIANLLGWLFVYLFLVVVLLSARLRRYDLKLFAADPSSSELVYHLSGELGFFVYYVGVYAAILTLAFALSGFLQSIDTLLLLLYWLPIVAMFILNQTSLSSIIRRAKWKTLNEIQAKVEKLQEMENFADKETMDAIKRLMDYHDRVKATRNSALDFNTVLSFINSLLLPLLAILLGNLDRLMALLPQRP